jgi:hypothetical protein
VSKPAFKPRPITANAFLTPDNLLGKKFIFSEDAEDYGMYEVIGYYMGKDKSIEYDILFEVSDDSDDDPIRRVGAKEMTWMLDDSLYIPVDEGQNI